MSLPSENDELPRLGLNVLIVIILFANLITPGVATKSENSIAAILVVGEAASEVILLAIWIVLGSEAFPRRLSQVILLGLLGVFSISCGVVAASDQQIESPVGIICGLLAGLLFAVVSGIVWIYRRKTGKRLLLDPVQPVEHRPFQFSVKQIFGWTTGSAVVLLLCELLFRYEGVPLSVNWIFVPPLILAFASSVLCALLSVCCLELALGSGSKIVWLGLSILACLFLPVVVTIMVYSSSGHTGEFFIMLSAFFVEVWAILTILLSCLRAVGFCLTALSERSQARELKELGHHGN
jgi:hypothetical protein